MDASERRVCGRRTINSREVQKTKLKLFFLFLMNCLSFRRAQQDRQQGLTSFLQTVDLPWSSDLRKRGTAQKVPSPPADEYHQVLRLTELPARTNSARVMF